MQTNKTKTLYISDLDGTLLQKDASVSSFAREELNRMIGRGLAFSISTARSTGSVLNILDGLNLTVPIAMFNGALYYDMAAGKFVKVFSFSPEKAAAILQVMERFGLNNTMYCYDGEGLLAAYRKMDTEHQKKFMAARQTGYKQWVQTGNLPAVAEKYEPVFFSFSGEKETLDPAKDAFEKLGGTEVSYYPDGGGVWYLELQPAGVDKRRSVQELKKLTGAGRVVCFGDNHNDLPMKEAADEFLVMENGEDAVKRVADKILPPNTDDGVVRYLMALEQNGGW